MKTFSPIDSTSRPWLLLTGDAQPGLRSLAEVRRSIEHGRAKALSDELLGKVTQEMSQSPWTPTSAVPERDTASVERADREHAIVEMTANRIRDAALAALITGERRYVDAALTQVWCLFDTAQWPEIDSRTQVEQRGDHCSLRRGQLALALGLAYDWLHGFLDPGQRRQFLDGFEARFIQALRLAHEAGDRITDFTTRTAHNNFVPVIYGGFAVAGLALAGEHEHAEWLVQTCRERMDRYLREAIGPAGEGNESVAYSGAAVGRSVTYLLAEHYAAGGQSDIFERYNLTAFYEWYMHFTLPPGRLVEVGDVKVAAAPATGPVAALASVRRDPCLQWYYLHYTDRAQAERQALALELLYYDPSVPSAPPEGRLPLGRAYHHEDKLLISRSSWEPNAPSSVVWATAGRAMSHSHPDWGQLCIDGLGERLIVDLGMPSPIYPEHHFEAFYNYQQLGHNVLVFGENETGGVPHGEHDRQGLIAEARFDELGAAWTFDLTPVYDQAHRVTRHVVHRLPRVVAVLDEAELATDWLIRLRWHTAAVPQLESPHAFSVENGEASLAAWVERLDGEASQQSGHHFYEPPHDRGRLDTPLEQRHEPFVELSANDRTCRILSLFCVGQRHAANGWQREADGWSIQTPEGEVRVTTADQKLRVESAE